MNKFTHFKQQSTPSIPPTVSYQRLELNIILALYGRMLAAGEWRDYGISSLDDAANSHFIKSKNDPGCVTNKENTPSSV